MINKKTFLIVSGVTTAGLVIMDRIGTSKLCSLVGKDTVCMGVLYSIIINFFPIISLFFLSLIIYKMRDEVYRAWVRFAYVWIPLSMIAIFFAPEYSGDWMYPIEKGSVAFLTSAFFVIISLIIIIRKYFVTRHGK